MAPPEAAVKGVQSPQGGPRAADTARLKKEAGATVPEAGGIAELPEVFGQYRIVRKLGHGGMAAVYLAEDTVLQRQVAIKVPLNEVERSEEVLARFLREARAAASLSHPNICQIYEIDKIGERDYIAMEYVDGKPLSDLIRGKQLKERQAASLVRKIALAMQAAHEKGLIHRDLKPSNVMLTVRGEPKITDFGLAKRWASDDSRLSHSGAIMGTPAYMPREQALGETSRLGPAVDIYSLGVILYELLTGRLPFEGPLAAVLGKIISAEASPPSSIRQDLDPQLDAICRKAMAKEPEGRYASMAEFAAALAAWSKTSGTKEETGIGVKISPKPRTAARAGVPGRPLIAAIAAGAVALVALGIVLYFATNHGTIKIELSDAAAQVEIKVDGDRIEIGGLKEPLSLRAGEHGLVVSGKDFETVSQSFVVKRGDNPLLRVELQPKPTVVADPNRRAAEWALTNRAVLRLVGDPNEVKLLSRLPKTPFKVEEIRFPFGSGDIADGDLLNLRGLANLQVLELPDTAVTNAGLVHVKELRNLRYLSLWSTQVTDDGLAAIADLRNLKQLTLSGGITDAGLKHLNKLTQLEELHLGLAKGITGSGFTALRDLTNLRRIACDLTDVGDIGLSHLAGLVQLDDLNFGSAPVTDAGLEHLKGLKNLRNLNLSGTRVTDTGVKELIGLKKLENLDLSQTSVTASVVGEVKAALPKCNIPWSAKATNYNIGEVVDSSPSPPSPSSGGAPQPVAVKTVPKASQGVGETHKAGDERIDNALNLTLIWCPPGSFRMGSPVSEFGRGDDENQVNVELTEGFWLGKYEVTQREFERVTGTTPWIGNNRAGANLPATFVSHSDAVEFCRKLTERERTAGRLGTQEVYTLPTEAQWEYACRAGTTTAYSFGNSDARLGVYAWFYDNAFKEKDYAPAVGLKKPNGWGLFDMHGNVLEWCRDAYAKQLPGGLNPEVIDGNVHVLRGGCWSWGEGECRSACRCPESRNVWGKYTGFRISRTP
jgi:formylglycine-generating enzyme required for sulfatase activity/predicted Ser/Thr protein kinase